MALPVGQISFSEVNVELTRPATQLLNIDDGDVRFVAAVGGAGTVISMNDLRGKSFITRIPISLVISANTTSYNIFTNRGPTYVAGSSDITLTINPSIYVGSTSPATAALTVPSAFDVNDTITIVNQGFILGKGGNGGNAPIESGTAGGTALSLQRPATIDNQNVIGAGGGGGGGGRPGIAFTPRPSKQGGPIPSPRGGGGGGGAAGFSVGIGGVGAPGNFFGNPGSSGTTTSGGLGGSATGPATPGGTGGGLGSSGLVSPGGTPAGVGGAAGSAIVGNPFVTWTNFGTRTGNIS